MKKPELLAPAGDMEKLKIAVHYGADAVYAGGKTFGLRSAAGNFTLDDIAEAVRYCHSHQRKFYVTVNIIPHEDDLRGLDEYLLALDETGVDAVIAADLYIVMRAKYLQCRFAIHLSTQSSVANELAIQEMARLGVDRVVLAREVDYESLKEIHEHCAMDLEYFIHGAMCVNWSGRCMLSNYYSRRDANRGGCSQSCRWFYHSGDEPFRMAAKDLVSVRELPLLMELGIAALKIEGRMKSIHYIATVVSCYRKLIDLIAAGLPYDLAYFEKEIAKAANRQAASGFFYGVPDAHAQIYDVKDEKASQDFVLMVKSYENGLARVQVRNYFEIGDRLEFFSPYYDSFCLVVDKIYDDKMNAVEKANHPMSELYILCDRAVYPDDMARRV